MVSAQVGSGGPAYAYDGSGQRVTKTWGSQTTTYVYDAMGNLAAEYGYSVPAPCTTCYVSVDQLGSTRVLTDAQGNVKERHDYMPFGDDLPAGVGGRTNAQGYLSTGGTPGVSVLFTGQYRDTELANSNMGSGMDFFGARHHVPAFGRFMQADQPFTGQDTDPQSWHLYGYARNNPFVYIDPTGRDVTCSTDEDGNFSCVDNVPPPPPDPWAPGGALFDLWWNSISWAGQVAQQTEQLLAPVVSAVDTFRHSPNCAATLTAAGTAAGAGIGAYGGATGGGALGFLAGSVVPVAGNAAGLAGGGAAGAAAGGFLGGVGGYAVGGLAGTIFCSGGGGGSSSGGGGGGEGGGTSAPKNGWTNKLAREKSSSLGFRETKDAPFSSHGQLTFKSGNRWITPDVDGHSGFQTWKVFDSAGNRLGTYNTDLTVRLGK